MLSVAPSEPRQNARAFLLPVKSDVRPMVGDLMAEKLYYAEGRQHPEHPLHGSHEGLWAGSDR